MHAALYLRVSTARQAEHDVSISDQKRQGEAWCASRGYELVETFVEPGATATNDRRPEFQRMIEAGTSKPAPFDVVIVHSFSRFFRDAFDMAFSVRKLAKNGVKLVSITQEIGDDPMHVMMRQIMTLFDEYQSKENAKNVLRAMKSGVAGVQSSVLKWRAGHGDETILHGGVPHLHQPPAVIATHPLDPERRNAQASAKHATL